MSEKILHIRSNSTEPNMKLPVKYLSEIITARVEEIMMAILYEIYQSGYADSIRSGIVVTGGCAQMANLGNYIYDISGYRVRTGYAGNLFSYSGCEGLTETSATASLGLLLAAKDDMGNCAQGEETVEVAAPEIYNPFDFPVETVPAVERFTTDNLDEQENAGPLPAEDPVTETEDVTPIAQTYQEPVQRTIFRPEEIETVPKKPKEKNSSRIRVFWKKISETAENLSEKVGSLYDNVNQDIDNENV
jgi:cell division ATPase FtsA